MRIPSRSRWGAFALVFVLASCGGEGDGILIGVDPIDGPGTYTREMGVDQLRRSFLMYVPPSAILSAPLPVVMVLHGNPWLNMQTFTQMNEAADTLGFVAVYPQSWNVGEWAFACTDCNVAAEQGVDDVKYFRAILQQMRMDLDIDDSRIYVSGFSQGALMAFKVGCELSSEVAGIGVISGIPWDWHLDNCSAPPVHTLWMVGTEDSRFPWEGEVGPSVSQLPGPEFGVAMAAKNGCTGVPIETAVADLDPTDGTTATVREYVGCSRSFVQYRFDGMDHNWPGSPFTVAGHQNNDLKASGVIARFFLANPR